LAETLRKFGSDSWGKGNVRGIGLKVGAVVNRYKMAKHFELDIGEATFAFRRKMRNMRI
jgi:hypothetical protein